MLLHTRSAKLVDPIPLPEWIRAPLGISRHTMVYVAQRNNDIGCELVVSPWRLNLWDDLWRIDFDFDDKVGLVAKLIKILDDNSVNVLSCETGVAGHCHTVEMICDCSGYDSEIDGASAWRRGRKEKPQLLGLTARIATEMINDLRFRRYEGPRLRIRRVNAYRRAHQDLDCAGPAKVLKGALVLPPAFLNSVRAHLRTGSEIWYSLTTDTKDRLLRVLLTGPGAVLLQLKLYVDKNARVLGQILEAIRALGLSILKSQLRHSAVIGPGRPPDGHQWEDYATFDLTLGFTGPVNAPAASTPKLLTGLCNLAPTQRGDIIVAYDQKGATAVPLRPEWPATVLHHPRIVGRHEGPMLRRQIASKVKKTRDKLVNKLQQGVQIPENGARLRAKIRFLEEQGRNLNPPTKSLFISYSADDLDPRWLSLVADLAKKRFNFDVRTGFDYSRIQNLLKRCLTGIEESACFLSIMSRPSVVTDGASPGLLYAPSTWVVEEKGMALAMGKPFHLLVSDGIHKDFFQRTTPGLKHTIFQNDDFADFERAAKEALDTLSARYEEIVLDRQILS